MIIISLIAIAFFILGFAFLIHGLLQAPAEKEVVARSVYDAVKAELQSLRENEINLKLSLDKMTVELQNMKGKVEAAKALESELNQLKRHDQEKASRLSELGKDFNFLKQKADQQAQQSLKAIETLMSENEQLKAKWEGSQKSVEELKSSQEAEKRWKQELAAAAVRIKDLEDKLKTAPASQGALKELQGENERWKAGLRKITDKMQDLEEALVSRQQQEVTAKAANQNAGESAWQQEKAQWLEDLKRLNNLNHFLKQKEDILQRELNKARAQALGLEKVCAEFKAELEKQYKAAKG